MLEIPSEPAGLPGEDPFAPLVERAAATANRPLQTAVSRAQALIRHARATNTVRSYRTAWRQYTTWCSSIGLPPLNADPQVIGLYLATLSETHRFATLRTRLAAIAAIHRTAGVPLDLKHQAIAGVLEGCKRTLGEGPWRQAEPLLYDTLPALLATFDASPLGRRDRALVLLGFAAALRRSELAAIDLGDILFGSEGMTVTLHRSKTNQTGKPQTLAVCRNPTPELCAATALEQWLAVRGRHPGPLFTRVLKGGFVTGERICDQVVWLVMKRAAAASGLDATVYSGHSLRAGLTTSAARSGAEIEQIMTQTRHRSLAGVRRYIRDPDLWHQNVTARLFVGDAG